MKRVLLSTLLPFFFIIAANCQVTKSKKSGTDDHVFEKIEINAHTNQKQWTDHIHKGIQLPDSMTRLIPAGTYSIKVQFVVDIHGNLGRIEALNDPGYGLAKKAVSIISDYKGKWQPANQCGKNVKAYREEVITFVIADQ